MGFDQELELPIITTYIFPQDLQNSYVSLIRNGLEFEETQTIEQLKDFNVFIGANNAGKSRLIRSLYIEPDDRKIGVTLGNPVIVDEADPDKQVQSRAKIYRVYLPLLRGLRDVRIPTIDPGLDLYLLRTVNDYFKGKINLGQGYGRFHHVGGRTATWKSFIQTGTDFFSSIRSLLLGNRQQRKSVSLFENWLSDSFFGGVPISIIPRETKDDGSVNDEVYVGKLNGKELPISLLGDGVQQLILMLWPIFEFRDDNLILFIEEPETSLHAGFQRIFIDTVLKGVPGSAGKVQLFVTTHSSQFIDMTLDYEQISVFKCRGPDSKRDKHTVELMTAGDRSILGELGIRNSSLLFTNCTIWVEGISDRMYFRRYLEILQTENINNEDHEQTTFYKEDLNYSFVEYSGGNITHWSFMDDDEVSPMEVETLCGRLMLIADRDWDIDGEGKEWKDKKAKKEPRQEELKETLGDRFVLLESREVENLLTFAVIKKVIQDYEEKKGQAPFLVKDVEQVSYRGKPLGEFIEKNMLDEPTRRTYDKKPLARPFAGKSGTVKGKRGFASKALKYINTRADMSAEAIKITEKLLDFIKANNPAPK